MLDSAEHEISNAHKYKISRILRFSGTAKLIMLYFSAHYVKIIVGILAFMSMEKFTLS